MILMCDAVNSPEVKFIEHYRLKGLVCAIAESCTGGMIASRVTAVPGASAVFLGGVISYADAVKRDLLGVPQALLESVGAVSAECAKMMALGVRQRFKADVALAVTGIAGPTGGTEIKPVGTVFFGVATAAGLEATCYCFSGDRESIRRQASDVALALLLAAGDK